MNADFPFESDAVAFWSVMGAMVAMPVSIIGYFRRGAGCGQFSASSPNGSGGAPHRCLIRDLFPQRSPPLGMGFLRQRKPDIKTLARNQDMDRLVEAASYQDPMRNSRGTVTDVDWTVPIRVDAILALGALDPASGTEVLERSLHDHADPVRCAAVRVLHTRQEISLLVHALSWLPAEGDSRKLVLSAIFELQESVTAAMIGNALIYQEDEELLGEDEATLILALLDDDQGEARLELINLLVGALSHERGIVADRAGELLLRLAPASTNAVVAELRAGAAPAEAAYVLGRIADPKTLHPLLEGLRHSDASARAESASALAELQDPAAVEPLLRATRDTDHGVRNQARIALDRLGNTAVIVGVAALLQPTIREAVQSAVGYSRGEPDGPTRPEPPPALAQLRSRRSNGGLPKGADPRPEA